MAQHDFVYLLWFKQICFIHNLHTVCPNSPVIVCIWNDVFTRWSNHKSIPAPARETKRHRRKYTKIRVLAPRCPDPWFRPAVLAACMLVWLPSDQFANFTQQVPWLEWQSSPRCVSLNYLRCLGRFLPPPLRLLRDWVRFFPDPLPSTMYSYSSFEFPWQNPQTPLHLKRLISW